MSIALPNRGIIATATVVSIALFAGLASLLHASGQPARGGEEQAVPSAESTSPVSWDEYEAAIEATIQCMETNGLTMRTEPHLDASGKVLRYTVWLTGNAEEDTQIKQQALACEQEHESVKHAWAEQLRPSDDQYLAAQTAMAECLIAGGTSPEVVSVDRLPDAAAFAPGTVFPDCAAQVSKDYGIPSFGG